ncbi:MAG: hypothetical protein CO030_03450, partial [Candidatus Magasanikbacteria bacterium CG_4_9_14_0_2_um_filter_42_11]
SKFFGIALYVQQGKQSKLVSRISYRQKFFFLIYVTAENAARCCNGGIMTSHTGTPTTFVLMRPFDETNSTRLVDPRTIDTKIKQEGLFPKAIVCASEANCQATNADLWMSRQLCTWLEYSVNDIELCDEQKAWGVLQEQLDGITKIVIVPPRVADVILSIVSGMTTTANWPLFSGHFAIFKIGSTGEKVGDIRLVNPFAGDDHGVSSI